MNNSAHFFYPVFQLNQLLSQLYDSPGQVEEGCSVIREISPDHDADNHFDKKKLTII